MRKPAPRIDSLVLGAGIVGVSIALHLQERGQSVLLVDRREPGSETSHGNAGLIERASVIPYAFPRDLRSLLGHATNRSIAVRYRWPHLLRNIPWLTRYWWHSHPARLSAIGRSILPLIEGCIEEHRRWECAAGTQQFMRDDGWIELYRSQRSLREAEKAAARLESYRLEHAMLGPEALAKVEPAIQPGTVAGAIHWRDPWTVGDPRAVTRGYAALFTERGGMWRQADAMAVQTDGATWSLSVGDEFWQAKNAVIALGPWSGDLCARLGYRFPLAVKRGYHMHYEMLSIDSLKHPICDADAGFVISPMDGGIRLTTGVELAARDAPPDHWQIDQAEDLARRILPLGRRLDAEPWRGARPCLPDMLPIIGQAPRHPGLWLAFGHAHHGFTLGPMTGRLLAEMLTNLAPFADPGPFSPLRFRHS